MLNPIQAFWLRPRLLVSVGLTLVLALILPFVDQVWQVYLLVFVLQACSAAFTPETGVSESLAAPVMAAPRPPSCEPLRSRPSTASRNSG